MSTPSSMPFAREQVADPFPVYHLLRRSDPVHWEPSIDSWVLTRYADVVACLRDPRFGRDVSYHEFHAAPEQHELLRPVLAVLDDMMLFSNPPKHTRLRGLANRAFTPRAVAAMRAEIQRLVDEMLDAASARGRLELIAELAYPLPTIVICAMLGLPSDDHAQLRAWTADLAVLIGNVTTSPDEDRRVVASVGAMVEYFRAAAAERRARPGDDLLSALVQAEEGGARLSEPELLANAILLLGAGHETTTNLIGNGTWALLRHPDQLARLRADPSLVESAAEEVLRWDGPVQLTSRVPTTAVELGGKRIEPGQRVFLVLGAANRDPEHFPEPDRFDISRRENRHVGFGHGPHFCLGAPLARLEGQVALGSLARRLAGLRLAGSPPTYRPNFGLRGLEALELVFDA